MSDTSITIERADLTNLEHQQALLSLLDSYAFDPDGNPERLPPDVRQRVVTGLQQHPTHASFLAFREVQAVGLAVTFGGFSTFRGKPLVNLHDLVVHPDARGTGVGSALMQAVEDFAKQQNCCSLTLEVQMDNDEPNGCTADSVSKQATRQRDLFLEEATGLTNVDINTSISTWRPAKSSLHPAISLDS